MRDRKLNIQDLEAKDMNRPVDALRYDISDPRNPMNVRKRGAEKSSGGGKRRKQTKFSILKINTANQCNFWDFYLFRMDTRNFQNSNFNVKYSNETDYQKLKNKMRNEYRKTIHDMIVINRFMKTDDKTIKKLEGKTFLNSEL